MSKNNFKMFFTNIFKRKKKLTSGGSFNVDSIYAKSGSAKGADIWGSDWPIPVAEKLEWNLFTTSLHYDDPSRPQYITTKLTDYILWFIPFSYDEYIVEVPNGTFQLETITHKQVVEMIDRCCNWNKGGRGVRPHDGDYGQVTFLHMKDRWDFKLGNNDFSFMKADW